jgi:hypothetical protein
MRADVFTVSTTDVLRVNEITTEATTDDNHEEDHSRPKDVRLNGSPATAVAGRMTAAIREDRTETTDAERRMSFAAQTRLFAWGRS